jgi:kynureninase
VTGDSGLDDTGQGGPADDVARRFVRPAGTYLLSHSIGLSPSETAQHALEAHLGVWDHDPAGAWTHWLAEIEGFRSALAALLGHEAAWFCPQVNVSSGLTKVLQALRPSGSIVMTEEAFPSLGFVIGALGAHAVFVERDADVFDLDVWAERFDTADPVGAVLITHVHSNTGELLPVADIARLARERGILTIVDVAQSAGVIPIDLRAWDVDVVLGSCVKWLCGGPGAGWMWVRPDVCERSAPTDVGWFSHEDPFEFDIHSFRPASDASRFWGGTPSVLPFAIARRSIELIDAIGVRAIRAHNVALTSRLIDALHPDLVVNPTQADRRSATVVIDAGRQTDEVVDALVAAEVHVDRRPTGIRVSPHVYNAASDIDTVVRVIDGVLGTA